MFYTWREFFARKIRDIKPTDLIEHAIDLKPDVKPVRARPKRYTQREREFAAKIFPEMEESSILI